jgi:hypothetical protein
MYLVATLYSRSVTINWTGARPLWWHPIARFRPRKYSANARERFTSHTSK